MPPAPIELAEEQVLHFRARRGHLAGAGAPSAAAAARSMLGAQSQQLLPSLRALSMRTRSRPTVGALRDQLLRDRRLVRTWGQRDTLHVYDPADWASVVAARADWAPGGRVGPLPDARTLDRALAIAHRLDRTVTRGDLLDIAPGRYVDALADRARGAGLDPARLAASRLVWCLALRGDLCVAEKVGGEQAYATRTAWFPSIEWVPQRGAAIDLARRYLAVHGPASPQDVAHFFGARVAQARAWLQELSDELVPVTCGDRRELVALRRDVRTLRAEVPRRKADWPLRLLPTWESMLMAHADKSWTVPVESERRLVWRKAAFVSPVVLARGRVIGTWSQVMRRGRLVVEIKPLSGWRERFHASAAQREADALAAHLEAASAEVVVRA